MIPVESVIPLSTSLNHLDDYDARMKLNPSCSSSSTSTSSSATSSGNVSRRSASHEDTSTAAPAKAIQVQFRKKETEEQVQARLNSFAYLQRQVDDEPWIDLKHFQSTVRFL